MAGGIKGKLVLLFGNLHRLLQVSKMGNKVVVSMCFNPLKQLSLTKSDNGILWG